MENSTLKKRTVNYTMERKCERGGFCFYRLEEPNGSDTYYAVSILHLLDINFKDDSTVRYLKNMQKEDGSYSSIYSAYYSIKSLLLLQESPLYDPRAYIQKNIRFHDADNLPIEIISLLKPMFYSMDLCSRLEIKLDNTIRDNLVNFVLALRNKDNGFGNDRSTLLETSQALLILDRLNYPIDSLETEQFIKECENSVCGFSNMPNTAPSFMEHIHAGITASTLVSYKPRYLNQSIDFIKGCQKKNGGFSRSLFGISTLEYTYYAIHSLSLLSTFK